MTADDPRVKEAHERIAEASGRKNNDTAEILADVAIRDGEAWNDRRLPEMGRALRQALREIDSLAAGAARLAAAEAEESVRVAPAMNSCFLHGDHLEDDCPECWRRRQFVSFTSDIPHGESLGKPATTEPTYPGLLVLLDVAATHIDMIKRIDYPDGQRQNVAHIALDALEEARALVWRDPLKQPATEAGEKEA